MIIVIVLGQGMRGDHIPRHQYFVLFDACLVANYYSENSEGAKMSDFSIDYHVMLHVW
jgi:hypothetical protein